jgi:ABC-type amino acid transport substrate-binding protein
MYRFIAIFVATIIAIGASAQPPAPTPSQPLPKPIIVTHKLPDFGDLTGKTFELRVIELALEKTQTKNDFFDMVPINVVSRTHAIAALNQNLYENFVILLSYEDALLESGNLIYIPFPLELGALSYRICYANKNILGQVQGINSLQQLQQYKVGVGAAWVDAKILQHHGVKIVEGSNITSLFRMTQAGRADLFCPSPSEYFHELRAEQTAELQLDNKLALYYPLPKFLFAHKSSKALLDRIQKGIEIAYKDGSYMQLWDETQGQAIIRADLSNRNLIKLENPFINSLSDDYKQYLVNPQDYSLDQPLNGARDQTPKPLQNQPQTNGHPGL